MIRLLVADDSPLMRRLLTEVFEAEGDFTVQTARDGEEALASAIEFEPDVITMDVRMPGMDGLTCLDRIMVQRPTPVVMVSSVTGQAAEETIRALELGAVDAVAKPSGAVSIKMEELGPRLVEIVRAAAGARLPKTRRLLERVRARQGKVDPAARAPKPVRRARPTRSWPQSEGIVVVGASTGGPSALEALLSPLPANFPWPILIAQHMPANFTGPLAQRLDALSQISVAEVTQATLLRPGSAYIGRGDADLIVSRRGEGLAAMAAPASDKHRWHPSVDRLCDSVLNNAPASSVIGVLMTGMGDDGAAAMTRLHQAGGRTIAEAEETAVVWGMPGELVRAGGADFVAPLDAIARRLINLVAAA